ncbi:calcium-binding protein [Gemmobacter denitrificans]|uniref:Calcium-binding protein n=1 Tax=Gemmobacter denitrificans TaxID=3123040 RepID=A0ABU8BRW2_9RHOB
MDAIARLTTTANIKKGLNLSSYLEREFGYINRDDPSDVFAFLMGGNTVSFDGNYSVTGSSATGTVTGFAFQVNGAPIFRVTGLSLSASTLFSNLRGTTVEDFLSAVFAGNDSMTGTDHFRDHLLGFGGNDTLNGLKGNDTLDGGTGNDELSGGNGNDRVIGGAGNDFMQGNQGSDTLLGGAGNDTLQGGLRNDLLNGGTDDDELSGGNGDGGEGEDVFVFDAGHGRDVVKNFSIFDSIVLDDIYWQGKETAADVIDDFARVVGDTVVLTNGANRITVEFVDSVDDLVAALESRLFRKSILDRFGNDTIDGGSSSDRLHGWVGNDRLNGGAGADNLLGDVGNDTLIGGTGKDLLQGGAGADVMYGQGGNDRLRGGLGADAFAFAGSHGRDRIADLTSDDTIVLSDAYWQGVEGALDLLQQRGRIVDGDLVIRLSSTTSVRIESFTDFTASTTATIEDLTEANFAEIANRLRTFEQAQIEIL